MKFHYALSTALVSMLSVASVASDEKIHVQPNLDGIELPENYKDWKIISTSHRVDNKTIRVIIGNDIAIQAARSNQTNPWPEGSILGKLVWKETTKESWPSAVIPNPNKFIHAEFMYKDTKKFSRFCSSKGLKVAKGKCELIDMLHFMTTKYYNLELITSDGDFDKLEIAYQEFTREDNL